MRSFCSSDIETSKTGQFSQMKLVGLAFGFGFLAVGFPCEFLLTSGVLGKINKRFFIPASLVFGEFKVFELFIFCLRI